MVYNTTIDQFGAHRCDVVFSVARDIQEMLESQFPQNFRGRPRKAKGRHVTILPFQPLAVPDQNHGEISEILQAACEDASTFMESVKMYILRVRMIEQKVHRARHSLDVAKDGGHRKAAAIAQAGLQRLKGELDRLEKVASPLMSQAK